MEERDMAEPQQQRKVNETMEGTSISDLTRRPRLTGVEKKAYRDFVLGGVSFLIGGAVTSLSIWVSDLLGRGVWIIAWGSVIFGLERCIRGLVTLKRGR